jgi:protein-arginine kinase activator protein McsA
MQCESCKSPATVHLTEIRNGKMLEIHLCENCAALHEGFPGEARMPITEVLKYFVTKVVANRQSQDP